MKNITISVDDQVMELDYANAGGHFSREELNAR